MGNNLAIRKLLLTTSSVACFALLLPLGASAAKAPPPKNLALTASPNPVVAGRGTVLRGQLKGKDHANKVVTLSGSAYPFTTTASNIATAVTDTNGNFSFLRRPSLLTRYTARAEGTDRAHGFGDRPPPRQPLPERPHPASRPARPLLGPLVP